MGNTDLSSTTISALTTTTITSTGAIDTNAASSNAITFSVDGSEKARVHSDGNVGIGKSPSVALDVNGAVQGTSAYQSSSDRRFKRDIKQLEQPLTMVLGMSGVSFVWKTEEFPNRKFGNGTQVGFI